MDTRREFIRKAALLAGLAGTSSFVPASIQRALAIDPTVGTTWEDAEHIIILMQENRSFDHSFGSLQGVRGFNDPRFIHLPDQNPVWLQSNKAGETYAPFHLDIKNTKATWMESLPHNWKNQSAARNEGRYDQWLNVKRNSNAEYADMPLTMGYYNREDIPFYYALADGFTICDQNFCSSLTGTTPNRLFFWTGTIRTEQDEKSRALVWNDDVDYESEKWKTFPEQLEENGISWKFYQNELSVPVGFDGDQDQWLGNFGTNPLEIFRQYNVKLHKAHQDFVEKRVTELPKEIQTLEAQLTHTDQSTQMFQDIRKKIDEKKLDLEKLKIEIEISKKRPFSELSETEKSIHSKAFVTNVKDPDYHNLEELEYSDAGTARKLKLPKGDLFYQFREDVNTGNLPMISWLSSPENLSDHPTSAWYGAWYISEIMDILTKNPDIWKKTIFILTYDENDGYFDHVPPFVAPDTTDTGTGKASAGIDTRPEYITSEQERERNGFPEPCDTVGPVGLGYRVPLIVASPWTRGGIVNSEIFDHTSTLQFLEKFIAKKTGKNILESNISEWRRTICGDLTSVFRPQNELNSPNLEFVKRDPFVESIYNAKFKKLPNGFKPLSPTDIELIKSNPEASPYMPQQEKGIRPSSGLKYQLYADGKLDADKNTFVIRFEASNEIFGEAALGSPFNVYAPGKYLQKNSSSFDNLRTWAFAVKAADHLHASWPIDEFENKNYHLQVFGPNGFLREFGGSKNDPQIEIQIEYEQSGKSKLTGNILLRFRNTVNQSLKVSIIDNAYKAAPFDLTLRSSKPGVSYQEEILKLKNQFGWYDFTVRVNGFETYERRFAGRVETGQTSFTDPFMGRMI
jgi:phospholipase C